MPKTTLFTRTLLALTALLCCHDCFGAGEKIGVLMKDKTSPYWTLAEKGALETSKDLKVTLSVKGGPNTFAVAAQTRLLEALLHEDLAALVISPLNPDLIRTAVAELAAKGVKIVTLDTPLDGVPSVHVSPDQLAMAEAAASFLARLVGGDDEVAVIKNNSVDKSVLAREKKAVEVLRAAHPRLQIFDDVYSSTGSASVVDQAKYLLEKHPNVKGIFASSSGSTPAIIQAVTELGLVDKIKIVGFGSYLSPENAAAIQSGALAGCLAQKPKELGKIGVELAVKLIHGETVPSITHIGFLLITRDNINQPEVQAMLTP